MTILSTILGSLAAAALATGSPSSTAAPDRPYAGHAVVRVEMQSLRDVRTMTALSDDPWTCGWDGMSPGSVDFRISPEARAALNQSGIRFTVLIDDVQRLVDAERAAIDAAAGQRFDLRGPDPLAWYAGYKPLTEVTSRLDQLVAARPDLASRVSVGRSLGGRDIAAVRITGVGDPGTKPAILINGCQHAREWITVMASMYLAESLTSRYDADPRVRRLVDSYSWVIVPIVNPDGYDFTWTTLRLWRKNRRDNLDGSFGVDINRNWSQGWGPVGSSGDPANEIYRGPAPFSEPETVALRDFIATIPNLVFHIDVHSYGQLILWPNGSDWALAPDEPSFAAIADAMQPAMYAVESKVYTPGPLYRNIYPVGGGICDWVYRQAPGGPLSMSYELRDLGTGGFVLPADQIVPTVRECLEGTLAAAEWLLARRLSIEHVDAPGLPVRAMAENHVRLRVIRGAGAPAAQVPPTLHWRIGRTGSYTAQVMTLAGTDERGAIWSAPLTAGPCGSVVQYVVTAMSAGGQTVEIADERGKPWERVAQDYEVLRTDSFESDSGWLTSDPTVGSPDDATQGGRWVRADPEGTTAQAEFDRSPLDGSACFITGVNPRGSAANGDVDGGKTTLVSPLLDLEAHPDPEIALWVWYSNNRGERGVPADVLAMDLTADGDHPAPAWVRAATLRAEAPISQATGQWRHYRLRVNEFITPSRAVRLRIVASDLGSPGTIEAAVDDLEVRSYSCSTPACLADWDGSGGVGVQDIFEFLASFFADEADADGSGSTTFDDLFVFLSRWFQGC